MTRHYCDLCGEELPSLDDAWSIEVKPTYGSGPSTRSATTYVKEVCRDCIEPLRLLALGVSK